MKFEEGLEKIKRQLPIGKVISTLEGLPIFELRLDNIGNPNGDIYFYIEDEHNLDDTKYEIIKVNEEGKIKEYYKECTEEDYYFFKVDRNSLSNIYKPFVSIENDLHTYIYYSTDDTLLRKGKNGSIRQYDFYPEEEKNKILPGKCNLIFNKLKPNFIYTFHDLKSNIPEAYSISFNINSAFYDIFKEDLFNLKGVKFF